MSMRFNQKKDKPEKRKMHAGVESEEERKARINRLRDIARKAQPEFKTSKQKVQELLDSGVPKDEIAARLNIGKELLETILRQLRDEKEIKSKPQE